MSNDRSGVAVSRFDERHLYHLDGRDWQLLLGPQTGKSEQMTMSIATLPPGSEPPLHVHPMEEEQVYVLTGQGSFLTRTDSIPLQPGVAIRVPVGVWRRRHQIAAVNHYAFYACSTRPLFQVPTTHQMAEGKR